MKMNPEHASGSFHSLEGKLLLADTSLRDPNFRRSVVFLSQHTPHGAHGFVLNQPMQRRVHQLLDGIEFEPLADVPVFRGGPVSLERLTFAALGWDNHARNFSFQSHLSTDDACAAHFAGKDVRAFVGYSGWTAGQMEKEIQGRSWIVQPASPRLADPDQTQDLWSRVLHDMGPFFHMLSLTPDSPEWN